MTGVPLLQLLNIEKIGHRCEESHLITDVISLEYVSIEE